jgi:hypothetical protein
MLERLALLEEASVMSEEPIAFISTIEGKSKQ